MPQNTIKMSSAFSSTRNRFQPQQQLVGNQEEYVRYLKSTKYPLVIATGPAGTGKTMLACLEAVRYLENKTFDRIVITRPTVIASDEDDIGFLPGTLETKMSPWMAPVMDYLYEAASRDRVHSWMSKGVVEIAPLGFMRGRTFKNTFVIGDECQNIRPSSMKMLLTRLGTGSKMVIVGDLQQTDLPVHDTNGLQDLIDRLRRRNGTIDGIAHVHLTNDAIVRHPLLPSIIHLYQRSS